MTHVIDDMPTMSEVENAEPRQLVEWYFYLRPTIANEELNIVKAIAARVDRLPGSVRQRLQNELRARHG